MTRLLTTLSAASLLFSLAACDRPRNVQSELEDLEKARANSAQVEQELREELKQTKQKVAEIEEKLALAEQGITDEVIEEREDVRQALQDQEKDVEKEVKEADQQAKRHDIEADKARAKIEETTPPAVDAEVTSEAEVQPREENIAEADKTEKIEIDQTEPERQPVRGEEAEPERQPVPGEQTETPQQ